MILADDLNRNIIESKNDYLWKTVLHKKVNCPVLRSWKRKENKLTKYVRQFSILYWGYWTSIQYLLSFKILWLQTEKCLLFFLFCQVLFKMLDIQIASCNSLILWYYSLYIAICPPTSGGACSEWKKMGNVREKHTF